MSFITALFKKDPSAVYDRHVRAINDKEKELEGLSQEALKGRASALKTAVVEAGRLSDESLHESFALVREAAKRTLGQRHFDVQLIGGLVLHEGKIAEMLTGEGKTLVATLPAFANALSGKGVHVVTVNDYLARRDAVWMGQIYHALGLSVACIVHDSAFVYDPAYEVGELDKERDAVASFKVFEKFLRPVSRKEAYAADITYGTNHEFGFDFLRDNLVLHRNARVQNGHHFVIIDEADSILIDEARTPLIISAPDRESSEFYKVFARAVSRLKPEEDYLVDEKLKTATITESGIDAIEKLLNIKNIFAPENARLVHFLNESLKAKALFRRDKEYVVKDGEIIIVDEFTGRMLYGRRYSGGLHQAIEAKESVPIKEENRTYATITIQNYFRLYGKVSGMTGTAATSAEEFHKVYGSEVVSIPPNKPVVRRDLADLIYKTRDAKYKALAAEVRRRCEAGEPILVGTTSIANNEVISEYLKDAGVPHEILNAKNHEREGEIIAQAGRPGAVTVATNMAGRGVDIVLGGNPPEGGSAKRVCEAGGLHVIGTERHDARRIDNQLRGRSGRQGDPGSSQFFLSLEDDLMRIFGGERIQKLMQALNFPEDQPIESGMVSKAVGQAQAKVEGINLDMREHLLEFDDVLNKQRTAIYARRIKFLEAGENNGIMPLVREVLENYLSRAERAHTAASEAVSDGEKTQLEELKKKIGALPESIESPRALLIAQAMVQIIDTLWIDHLENLESLRQSVNIRAYGQHEPLVEYRREAHKLYQDLQAGFESMLVNMAFPLLEADLSSKTQSASEAGDVAESKPELRKIGRNDPCHCGSGKKYKKCHGR